MKIARNIPEEAFFESYVHDVSAGDGLNLPRPRQPVAEKSTEEAMG